MSKLERLIEELCPDGVEYKSLGEVFLLKNGYTPSKKNPNYWSNGTVPWFRMEDIRTNGRILNKAIQNVTEEAIKNQKFPSNSIIMATTATIGEHALIECEFLCNQQLTCITIKDEYKNNLSIKYCFYYFDIIDKLCKSIANQGGGMPIVSLTKLKQLNIPVPPLPIQEEIVRILDSFTELNAELEKELEARKKQYEWYHQKLMDFNNSSLKYVLLGEYFEFKNGLNKEKDAFGNGTPIINFTDVYNHRYLNTYMIKGLVNVSEIEIERYNARKGDVFFTRTSETKDDIGMSSTLIEEIPNCVYSGFILRARPKTDLFLPKFCSYYFSTNQVRKEIIRYASVTTRATTTGPKLSKIRIPLVPKFEQQRIVDILDRFDKLCNDISEGLPAEIDARQKQYEYYRDKLLTFKRLEDREGIEDERV